MKYLIYNEDCVAGSKLRLKDNSVDLMICDPPFGISESTFDENYSRNFNYVIGGYVEAPDDYASFSYDWITEATRVLKKTGSFYIVSGHNKLHDVLDAVKRNNLYLINHIIWKYNFGLHTKKKYVTSHYHILYLKKDEKSDVTFNINCRYDSSDRDKKGSILYKDLEDVWVINREYHSKKMKNQNKLPGELVNKMILYSSNPGDVVCDFFMGNFT